MVIKKEEKKYGHFDDLKKEYVIDTPLTPFPWINYLGNESFFSLVSNTGGGYSFYKDARLRRVTRYQYNNSNLDTNGKYFYINDEGDVWNPGYKPVKNDLDSYSCRHGMGYTIIKGKRNDLEAELLSFVPLGYHGEIQQLSLRNDSDIVKEIDLFSYAEFCIWNAVDDMTNFQRTYSIGRAECLGNSIVHFTDYRDRRNHFAFFHVNRNIEGYECDREVFTGTHNGLDEPEAVANRKTNNSSAYGWNPVGVHHMKVKLKPGASEKIVFILGYVENPEEEKWIAPGVINTSKMDEMIAHFSNPSQVDKALSELAAYWERLLSVYRVEINNTNVSRMVNIWNQYQCMVTFNMSRSASYFESGIGRGMGFRDSNQDLLGFVHQVPERARERLIDLASTQLPDGGAHHQYQPLTKKGNQESGDGFNDDPLWLISAAIAYVRETGDTSLLDELVPFDNNPDMKATMFEHLSRSFYHVVNNLGPHKLPLIGRADWNDCMNLNIYNEDPDVSFQTGAMKTDGQTAESLMIAGAFVLYGREFMELCKFVGKEEDASEALKHIDQMVEAIDMHGWDGEWFLRAYDAKGNKVGTRESKEGRIFIESQGFCGMAGIGKSDGRLKKVLHSVKKHLDSEHGIVLVNPAFRTYHIELGEISTFLPGYKENAGIFCHNNPWIMIAETVMGNGKAAFDYWNKICPSETEKISLTHKTEPYVYSQMVGGKDAHRPGEAKNSWLTGTAAWNFVAITQYILGVRPQFDGLLLDPCIPPNWEGFVVRRRFRGAEYEISVKNPDRVSSGIKSVKIDGKYHDSSLLPIFPEGSKINVELIMGKAN